MAKSYPYSKLQIRYDSLININPSGRGNDGEFPPEKQEW